MDLKTVAYAEYNSTYENTLSSLEDMQSNTNCIKIMLKCLEKNL